MSRKFVKKLENILDIKDDVDLGTDLGKAKIRDNKKAKATGIKLKKDKDKKAEGLNYTPKKYTKEEFKASLDNYILIPPEMWYLIGVGAKIRYQTNTDEYKMGGYVKYKYYSVSGAELTKFEKATKDAGIKGERDKAIATSKFKQENGDLMFTLTTAPLTMENADRITFTTNTKNMKNIWKKFDDLTVIEIIFINKNLIEKTKQIKVLTKQVEKLEAQMKEATKNINVIADALKAKR